MLEHTAVVLFGTLGAMTKSDAIFKAGLGFAAFGAPAGGSPPWWAGSGEVCNESFKNHSKKQNTS